MHFPIIKIEPIDLPREDWDIDLDYEDCTLNEFADYYGEMYTEEERRRVIEAKWLKDLFEGIATIDTEKETITFLDLPTIKNTLAEYYNDETRRLYELAQTGQCSGYDLRSAGNHWRGYYELFVVDYGQTSMQFIEDATYRAGKTWQIGNIFDAHF